MTENKYHLDVQPDFVERQSAAKPLQALCEFVWNALDADSTKVEVFITRGELGLNEIMIRDNGHGMTHGEAEEQFQKLGGSWKNTGGEGKKASFAWARRPWSLSRICAGQRDRLARCRAQ